MRTLEMPLVKLCCNGASNMCSGKGEEREKDNVPARQSHREATKHPYFMSMENTAGNPIRLFSKLAEGAN